MADVKGVARLWLGARRDEGRVATLSLGQRSSVCHQKGVLDGVTTLADRHCRSVLRMSHPKSWTQDTLLGLPDKKRTMLSSLLSVT